MDGCFSSDLLFFKSLYVWVKFRYTTLLSTKTSSLQFIGASLDLYPENQEHSLVHQMELGFPELSGPEPKCLTCVPAKAPGLWACLSPVIL